MVRDEVQKFVVVYFNELLGTEIFVPPVLVHWALRLLAAQVVHLQCVC